MEAMRLSTTTETHVVELDDFREQFWKRNYLVHLDCCAFLANSDHEQDALDCIADYCQENGLNGLVAHPENEEQEREFEEAGYCQAGNESVYVTASIFFEEF